MSPNASDKEIVISRLVNAPRDRVWEVWETAEHLEKWWGPDGFNITTESFDFRVGGSWKFFMHGPDGTNYDNLIVFTDIKKPECIAHNHGGDGKDGAAVDFVATVTFEAEGDKTRVTMRSVFPTAEVREHVVKEYGAIEGGKQTLGKMDAYVTAS